MSRNAVRLAVASFLAAASIPGLTKVYKAMPTLSPGELLNLGADLGSGAVAWVHLDDSDEDRWSMPSPIGGLPSGDKGVHYAIRIMVSYQYLIPSATENTSTSPDDWVTAEDAILQGIKDRIHSDPQLGTGPNGTGTNLIFVAAQEPNSLKVTPDEPYLEAGKVISYHAVDFRVTEAIKA